VSGSAASAPFLPPRWRPASLPAGGLPAPSPAAAATAATRAPPAAGSHSRCGASALPPVPPESAPSAAASEVPAQYPTSLGGASSAASNAANCSCETFGSLPPQGLGASPAKRSLRHRLKSKLMLPTEQHSICAIASMLCPTSYSATALSRRRSAADPARRNRCRIALRCPFVKRTQSFRCIGSHLRLWIPLTPVCLRLGSRSNPEREDV